MRRITDILAHLFHPRRSNYHRPRVLHVEAYVLFTIISLFFGVLIIKTQFFSLTLGNILGYASDIFSHQVVEQTNQQRSQAGLSPLSNNQALNQAALAKGQDMFTQQYWAHTSPTGKEPWDFIMAAGYSYRVAGENLARDFQHTNTMISAWMASPTHRANIMNPRYSEIGIAVIDGILHGTETTLVVQMFGAPAQTADQSVTLVAASNSNPDLLQESLSQNSAGPNLEDNTTPIQLNESTNSSQLQSEVDQDEALTNNQFLSPTNLVSTDLVDQSVLARNLVPVGRITPTILFSPLHLLKALALAIIIVLVGTLIYDLALISSRQTPRFVGNNLSHIFLFCTVAFLIIFFRGGVIG